MAVKLIKKDVILMKTLQEIFPNMPEVFGEAYIWGSTIQVTKLSNGGLVYVITVGNHLKYSQTCQYFLSPEEFVAEYTALKAYNDAGLLENFMGKIVSQEFKNQFHSFNSAVTLLHTKKGKHWSMVVKDTAITPLVPLDATYSEVAAALGKPPKNVKITKASHLTTLKKVLEEGKISMPSTGFSGSTLMAKGGLISDAPKSQGIGKLVETLKKKQAEKKANKTVNFGALYGMDLSKVEETVVANAMGTIKFSEPHTVSAPYTDPKNTTGVNVAIKGTSKVKLVDANHILQPVYGTSDSSTYYVIALGEHLKVAARINSTQVSVRVEGDIGGHLDSIKASGIEPYPAKGYASVHITNAVGFSEKIIGSVILALKYSFEKILTDLSQIPGD